MQPLPLVLGLILLALGRRLYWAFVAIAGFVVGAHLAGEFLANQPPAVQWGAAILAGVVGALLAAAAQRLAFTVAGLLAGGYVAGLAAQSMAASGNGQWVAIAGGAIVGAIVAASILDWAIVVLSSLMGAGLVCQGLALAPPWATAAFLALTLVGVMIQSKALGNRAPPAVRE